MSPAAVLIAMPAGDENCPLPVPAAPNTLMNEPDGPNSSTLLFTLSVTQTFPLASSAVFHGLLNCPFPDPNEPNCIEYTGVVPDTDPAGERVSVTLPVVGS